MKLRNRPSARRGLGILLGLAMTWPGPGVPEEVLRLRQEYNEVAASIDTLVRLYGGQTLKQIAALRPMDSQVPAGFELALIFWADDEAEIFLNGYRLSDTRLTPTEVVIPSLYLQEVNLLRAHCWDTDRVESGFMAGLYLRDGQGNLRQVLVTEEGKWQTEEGIALELYYAHAQPEIPGARVIWGSKLFGEVWLETRFTAGILRQAARQPSIARTPHQVQKRPMETHEIVSRLVQLQMRRQKLEQELAAHRTGEEWMGYAGPREGLLAFTLGRAGPLAEAQSTALALQLSAWAQSLPKVDQALIYRERRPLKGSGAATPERVYPGGPAGQVDRRADYEPPAERGPSLEGRRLGLGRAAGRSARAESAPTPARLAMAAAGLILYLGVVSRQWWRLYRGKVWGT